MNKLSNNIFEWENPEIISDIIINSNYRNNSFLNFASSGCDLYFVERVKKYIFSENGNEIIYQTKYLNKGNSENCTLVDNLQSSYIISDTKIEGGDNLTYKINSDLVEFNFNLKSNKYAIISYKTFYEFISSKFFRTYTPYIQKRTKYIFRARQPFNIVGIEYGRLKEGKQKNGALYYYYNDSNYYFNETLYLSAYGIKFKSEYSVKLDFTIGRILKYLTVPNLYEFGNNEIISDKVLSNLKENEFTIENDKRFVTIKSNERYRKFNFIFSKEFQSKIDNEWVMEGADLENSCTIKIKNKALEILSNSNSKEKDYIILGRWVYYNIEYDLKYKNEEWTPDQILENKVGVCSHITRLYNAFLNCINIDAMYVKGYVQTENDNNINLENLHAWTLAKIDGKWVPLDATWNIFVGRLPLGFIFRYFGDYYRNTDVDWGLLGDKSSNIINEINFQSSSNPTLDLKVKVISFFSRDLEDDDEEDFKLNLDADDEGDDKGDDKRDDKGDFILNLDHNTYIIIISIVAALIIISIIVSVIYLKKRKRKDKNIDYLNASLSLNE
jgi:hypothetical protein